MNEPLLIFDYFASQMSAAGEYQAAAPAKRWEKFFPSGYLKPDKQLYLVVDSADTIHGKLQNLAESKGWLLCYCHLSWYRQHDGIASLRHVARHFAQTEHACCVFAVFVSEGGILETSSERRDLDAELQNMENLFWTTSKLDFPSRDTHGVTPDIAACFLEGVAKKMPALSAAHDLPDRQEKFRRLFAEYEAIVEPSPVVPTPAGARAAEASEIRQNLSDRDRCFRLFLLLKVLGKLQPGGVSPALRRVGAQVLEASKDLFEADSPAGRWLAECARSGGDFLPASEAVCKEVLDRSMNAPRVTP